MNNTDLRQYISEGKLDDEIREIICQDDVKEERERYLKLLDEAVKLYGEGDYHFVSSPGRSEIGGNHTDHQHGRVLAAALNIDNLAVFKKRDDKLAVFKDPRFKTKAVDLSDLSVHEEEKNTTESLIRGYAAKLKDSGYEIGGFEALCDSKVLSGSGISSSACFEVMTGEIFNCLYNEGKLGFVDRALFAQYAEREYFGKPCGLLDQMAISSGGFTAMDFKDPSKPVIERHAFSFDEYGYELVLVNTKGDHADLSDEYAAIPGEIRKVAEKLGVEYLRDSSKEKLLENISEIRESVANDRAILRSLHFYNEDERAALEKEAVKKKDIKTLLELMNASGRSSYMYLQNVYPASRPKSQSLALGLFLAEEVLEGKGASRVHGGGFDGTIQVVLPREKSEALKEKMGLLFGDGACLFVRVRQSGTRTVI